tara:strand:- start:191 stop:427 length:237 start_codon:yes stop_codon:yes gene_type:complete
MIKIAMELIDNAIIEWIASITAIVSIWLYGNKWKYAGYFGLFSQVFWWWFALMYDFISMIVLCGFMTATHIRNIFKMK